MTGLSTDSTGTADILPATYLEEEWVSAVDSQASNHNLPLAINIEGPFDRGLLEDVLRAFAARHETLRMAFVPGRSGVQRAVWPTLEPRLTVVDLPDGDECGRSERLKSMILEESGRPTDLTRPPLWRAFVVRLAPAYHVLVTIWHHAIFDGWSFGVAFRDLTRLYARALRDGQPSLPELEIQLADYAEWERQLTLPAASAEYWRSVLPGEPPSLPVEKTPGPDVRTVAGRPYPPVPAAQMKRLGDIARSQRVTLASALRSGVLTALRPYLPEQPVIGLVYGNRERPELQPVIGLVSDHLPVRFDLSGNPSFLDLVGRVHNAVRTARQHQAPSGVIMNSLPDASAGERIFDISINNMRHAAPLAENVTAPDGSTVRFTVRDIPTTELWPRINKGFSGIVRLGYQLHHHATGELTGDIWGHIPAFRTGTLDMLGRAFAETMSKVVSNPEQGIRAIAPGA
jgi:condensation domain-containing protein